MVTKKEWLAADDSFASVRERVSTAYPLASAESAWQRRMIRHERYAARLTLRSVRTMSRAARVCVAEGDVQNARALAILTVAAVRRLDAAHRCGL